MSNETLRKITGIVGKQQKILTKIAQQVIDTSHPSQDPFGTLDKVIHDATSAWAFQNKMSASSKFDAGLDGKNYDVNVILTITDPKKPTANTLAGQKALASFKQTFLNTLQSTFNTETQRPSSLLAGVSATFNVIVK